MTEKLKTKKFLNGELEIITKIHLSAKYYFEDVEYLNNPDTIREKIACENNFIFRVRIAFWQLGIIEIAKLFQKSKTQHFNLLDFLGELNHNYDKYFWLKNIPKAKIINWITLLNSDEILPIRDRLSIQRNKYFAHTDRNPDIELKGTIISFDEVRKLVNITEEIIFELKSKCFQIHIDLEIPGLQKAGKVLEAFACMHEKKQMEIKREKLELEREKRREAQISSGKK